MFGDPCQKLCTCSAETHQGAPRGDAGEAVPSPWLQQGVHDRPVPTAARQAHPHRCVQQLTAHGHPGPPGTLFGGAEARGVGGQDSLCACGHGTSCCAGDRRQGRGSDSCRERGQLCVHRARSRNSAESMTLSCFPWQRYGIISVMSVGRPSSNANTSRSIRCGTQEQSPCSK